MTTIAALIPTRQRRELVCRAIRSALAQTRPPDEVIVVDDGSDDGTAEAVRALDPTLTLVRMDGVGAAGARNRGAAATDATWLALLDSDDVWLPDHLARLEAATHLGADVVFDDAVFADGSPSAFERSAFTPCDPVELAADAADWAFRRIQPMMTPSSMIRRGAWQQVGGMREKLVCREDTHLFFSLALRGFRFAAAAGAGARIERPAASLTEQHHARAESYWACSALLYSDLHTLAGTVGGRRQELARRLATAEWRLGRLRWTQRRRMAALRAVAASIRHSPGVTISRLAARGDG